MRVTAVEVITNGFDLDEPLFDARSRITQRHQVLVRIEAEDGSVGWGEAAAFGGSHELVAVAIKQLAAPLIGHPARPRETARSLLRDTAHYGHVGVVVSAISGIEIALWDLQGAASGLDLSALLGGEARPVRWYGTTGFYRGGSRADEVTVLRDDLAAALDSDPSGLKIKVGRHGVDEAIGRAHQARAALGPERLLILDANNAFTVPEALRVMSGVRELDILFFEEPIPFGNPDASRELRLSGAVPVGGYELDPTFAGCRRYLEARAVDYIQPDACWSGGIAETMAIADLAHRLDLGFVPHNFSSIVATAANYHVVSAVGGDLIELDLTGNSASDPSVLRTMGWRMEGGYLQAPSSPGLGLVSVGEWASHA
ncbi:mandelate racemase/muconate lactonizing enzyme family protein [Streptomyces sp. NBC_00435]|uniref:mandelate racemase/muconate lactonizing enzyme family protein n=1 Tax=Streptomyces sp. NBC_00435 TaxID=2903649 RepID=UPI002E1BAEF8